MRNVPSRLRTKWDDRWEGREESGFFWHAPEPPAELYRLLDEVALPPGGSLDVGCGDGVVTWSLAERLSPAVGLDIALPAVQHAKQAKQGQQATTKPSFVVGDARQLPFGSASFSLVFDRGCMHNLPRDAYPSYLREVERVLRPGGVFELFFATRDAQAHGQGPLRAARRKIATLMRRRRPARLTEVSLARLLPPSMETISVAPSRFVSPKTGATVEFSHCVCRRTSTQP